MASSRGTTTNESRWTGAAWEAGVNTIGTSGYDYTSLSAWEGDTDLDVVTATVCPVIEVYTDVSIAATLINAGTTDGTYFRVVRATASARHGGDPSSGVTVSNTSTTATYVIAVAEAYSRVLDLKVALANNTATSSAPLSLTTGANARIVGCLVTATNAGGVASGINSTVNQAASVFNNIVYGCDDNGITGRGSNCLIDNNTVVGCGGYGFSYSSNACVWINNIAQSNTGGDYNGNGEAGTTHNLASDTTAPETGTWWDSKTITFVDAGNDDYRLTNDADAVGQGTDLSATFDDDIAYTTRS